MLTADASRRIASKIGLRLSIQSALDSQKSRLFDVFPRLTVQSFVPTPYGYVVNAVLYVLAVPPISCLTNRSTYMMP